MKGADKFCQVFRKNEQVGRLCICPGRHARGATFCLYVLPEGVDAQWNGANNGPLNKHAVEVYGIVCGQPGWSECYGWLYEGPWCDDFNKLYSERKRAYDHKMFADDAKQARKAKREQRRIAGLLATYPTGGTRQ